MIDLIMLLVLNARRLEYTETFINMWERGTYFEVKGVTFSFVKYQNYQAY